MPLYEYQCPQCGRFELIQKFSDAALTNCPTCGNVVEKLLSAPAIQFKGSGWYVTDYARKPSGDGSAKAEGAKGESAKSDGAKGETAKPETAKPAATPAAGAASPPASSGSSGSTTTSK